MEAQVGRQADKKPGEDRLAGTQGCWRGGAVSDAGGAQAVVQSVAGTDPRFQNDTPRREASILIRMNNLGYSKI